MAVTELQAEAATACEHCGLQLPAGRAAPGPGFCCAGCEAAWSLIHDGGLAAYYALPERRREAVAPSGRAFEELDHPAFRELHVRRGPDGAERAELFLEGLHCASCVWLVERTPLVLEGLLRAEVDLRRGLVRLEWDPSARSLPEIARALDRLGYHPRPFRGGAAENVRRAEDRAAIAAIGIAGALAANVMLLALALYSGWFTGMDAATTRYFRWLSLALTTASLLGPGRVFFRSALGALRVRTLHIDVPIALALAGGGARGAWNTVADRGPIYFDGLAALVFLLLVGRFLQRRAQRGAADATDLLRALAPATAHVIGDGDPRDVPVEGLLPGTLVEVRAGEAVPGDGRVVWGTSCLDLSLLTGESRPVAVGPGDLAWAGTLVRGAALAIEVERAGEETRLARLLRDTEEGARRRAPIARLADRLAGAFVAAVLALAALTFGLWVARDATDALDRAIALLIVTCPCTLALATPLAVTAAIGRAARAGILVRGGDALERLASPGLLVLDKTGTLTEGRVVLERWEGPDDLKPGVLALERQVEHPIAAGFRAAWPELVPAAARDVRVTTGGGVEGTVGGRCLAVGSPAFVRARIVAPCGAPPSSPARLTPVWVALDGRLAGIAAFADPLRPEAAGVLAALRRRGWRTRLLSGDDPAVATEVGRALGFAPEECRGGAGPEDKRAAIAAAAREGPVVMVGDGVNDAPAIAIASVGIGVRGGAEACLAAADVYLSRPGLAPLLSLLEGSRRTLAAIHRGIGWSLAYNLAGAGLAMAGWIDPLVAAVLMPASSITVVLAATRGHRFAGERP
jgi:Cu2+-exporting ATPase